jgi:hypothetical protein
MLYLIDIAACAIVTMRAIYVLNKMTFATRHGIGLAYLLMAIGGFATFFALLLGHMQPDWQRTLIDCSLACLIMFNKRARTAARDEDSRRIVSFQDDNEHTLVERRRNAA